MLEKLSQLIKPSANVLLPIPPLLWVQVIKRRAAVVVCLFMVVVNFGFCPQGLFISGSTQRSGSSVGCFTGDLGARSGGCSGRSPRTFPSPRIGVQDWEQKNGFSLLLRYLPSMLPWFYCNGHLSAIYFSVASLPPTPTTLSCLWRSVRESRKLQAKN